MKKKPRKLNCLLFLVFFLGSAQYLHAQSKAAARSFQIVDDFEKEKGSFKRDTFGLPNISVDGGKGIAYHTENKHYRVYELTLSGETEKFHYVFYADKNSKLKIVKQTEFKYDKPHAADNIRKETTTFYAYGKNSLHAYTSDRQPKTESDSGKKDKLDKLFETVVNRK